jgi:hypothetical protein
VSELRGGYPPAPAAPLPLAAALLLQARGASEVEIPFGRH